PGGGCVFSVWLPLAEGAQQPASEPPAAPQPSIPQASMAPAQRSSLHVLCVDDEPAVIALTRAALESRGHMVTASVNPQEALAVFEAAPDKFDVIVTDLNMPRLTGFELISAVRRLRPHVPCLLITGLEDAETEQRALALRVRAVVRKPFSIDELRDAVERAGAQRERQTG
ncbi:MAG TPA: response regulator, partial [Polyangiales bacterium]